MLSPPDEYCRVHRTAPAGLDATGAFCILSADPKTEAVQWTVEQRLDQLEKRNKRLTVALSMMVVAMCGAVAMGAKTTTEDPQIIRAKSVTAEYISAQHFMVLSDGEGWRRMNITTDDYGNGEIGVWNRKGKGRNAWTWAMMEKINIVALQHV